MVYLQDFSTLLMKRTLGEILSEAPQCRDQIINHACQRQSLILFNLEMIAIKERENYNERRWCVHIIVEINDLLSLISRAKEITRLLQPSMPISRSKRVGDPALKHQNSSWKSQGKTVNIHQPASPHTCFLVYFQERACLCQFSTYEATFFADAVLIDFC